MTESLLDFYRRHVHAINRYAEEQTLKGYSRAEALAVIECETFVTRPIAQRAPRRR